MTNTSPAPAERPADAALNATPLPQQPVVVNLTQGGIAANGRAPLPEKSTGTAYLLWLFFGAFGVHQFWLGNTGRGLLYLLTLGGLGIGLLIDLFTLPSQVRTVNARRAVGIA